MKLATPAYITDFRLLEPKRLVPQAETLEWLAEAHARAGAPDDMAARFGRYGAAEPQVATRGLWPEDFHHRDWASMDLFPLDADRGAAGMEHRTRAYAALTMSVLERFYAETGDAEVPSDLIHVTCTGYAAPSAAQRLVARKGWSSRTIVTHCYHMGCYAALPAIRIASSFVNAGRARVDVAHTEICSLHAHPGSHDPGQLVVESLFADGFARYTVTRERPRQGFRALAVSEELLPDSEEAMQWFCADAGMKMVLSREVPRVLTKRLRAFVETVARSAGLSGALEEAFFAIHPGGPKVIEHVGRALGLAEERLAWSREVLRKRGNMSSATLPHIWESLARDPAVPAGAPVISVAFGPGLTVCGAVFEKV